MKLRVLVAAALVVAASLAHAQDLDRLRKEMFDAEKKLAMSRIFIPLCDDAAQRADFEQVTSQYAAKTEVKDFAVKRAEDPATAAVGSASPLRLQHFDLSGGGEFYEVQRLLHRVAMLRLLRILDFESLHVQPRAGGTVTFDAHVGVVCWVTIAPPEIPFDSRKSAVEIESAAYRDKLNFLRAHQAIVDQTDGRMRPLSLIDAHGTLDEEWGEAPLFITELRYSAPDLTLRGVTVGTPARDAVRPALKKAGLEPAQIDWKANGDCREFTAMLKVKGTGSDIGSDKHPIAVHELFDERFPALCSGAPQPPAKVISVHGSGNLTAHTHDLDVASALYILNALSTDHGYIVAPDVAGRVRFDLDHATIDDVLAALKTAGIAISNGPIHLVCAAECSNLPASSRESDPISITVTDAEVRDILRTLERIAANVELYAPADLQGRVSMYLVDVPWARMLDGLAATLKTKVSIGPAGGMVRVDQLKGQPWRRSLAQIDFRKLAVADVRLAGIISSGDTRLAYADALGAPGRVIQLQPGTKLLDGEVTSIDEQSVSLKTSDGRKVVVPMK